MAHESSKSAYLPTPLKTRYSRFNVWWRMLESAKSSSKAYLHTPLPVGHGYPTRRQTQPSGKTTVPRCNVHVRCSARSAAGQMSVCCTMEKGEEYTVTIGPTTNQDGDGRRANYPFNFNLKKSRFTRFLDDFLRDLRPGVPLSFHSDDFQNDGSPKPWQLGRQTPCAYYCSP